jgi:hypothetical protein
VKIDARVDGTDPRPVYEPPKVTTFDESAVAATLGPVMLTRSGLAVEGSDPTAPVKGEGFAPHRR